MYEETLRDLLKNNEEYDAIIVRYNQKHENALSFMTSAEFWQEELNKIKDYIKPIEVKMIGGDFILSKGFNFTTYQQYAYEWLKSGEDWSIKNILGNAKNTYEAITGRAIDSLFNASIIVSLKRGAAYLRYEKFLKDKLTLPNAITIGDPGITYSVYDLLGLLRKKSPDNKLIYEVHDPKQMGGESLKEFRDRSRSFYRAFMNPGYVDMQASNDISYAAKIGGIWYFAESIGSNTYLGTGPTGVLEMREYCAENDIGILYIERNFLEWKNELLGNVKRQETTLDKTIDVKFVYEEINRKIKLVGNEFVRHLNDLNSLSETGCRSVFLSGLSTHSELFATGESENRIGRTDMLVIDKRINYRYIYEFKIYKETSDINNGLQQIIFQYPTQEDNHNGLVILSRKKADLAKTLQLIYERVNKSGITITQTGTLADDSRTIQIQYENPRNSVQVSMLTIFVFDLQQ